MELAHHLNHIMENHRRPVARLDGILHLIGQDCLQLTSIPRQDHFVQQRAPTAVELNEALQTIHPFLLWSFFVFKWHVGRNGNALQG